MSFFKLLKSYEHNFEDELKRLIENKIIKWKSDQICITTIPGKENDYLFGNGSLDLDYDNEYEDEDGHLIVPKREVPLQEKDFTVVCDQFKNTLFEQVYNELSNEYVLGRVRLIMLEHKECFSWHKDYNDRLHIPIITHDGCFMIIEKQIEHLEANKLYFTETTKYHTAINGSFHPRVHFVACIVEKRNES
tara:strand:- start:900 stop:1472 length:573 start_codon:yes stop_codon:yes gene_type:complete